MDRLEKILGPRSFRRRTFNVALPIMFQQLITSSVGLVDSLMVGQLGDAAISAVGSANKFFLIGLFALFGTSNVSAAFIAQYYGAGDEDGVKQCYRYSLIASLLAIIPIALLGCLIPTKIMGMFSSAESLMGPAIEYIPIAAISMIPMAVSFSTSNALRALGNTKIPFLISAAAVVTNFIFNGLLIFGLFGFPRLGIMGAAVGTLISRIVELFLNLYVTLKNDFVYKTKLKNLFKIGRNLVKRMTLKVIPLTINECGYAGGLMMLLILFGTRGENVLASMNIATDIMNMFIVLVGGLAAATTVLVAQPLGANKIKEARQNAHWLLRIAEFYSLGFALLMFISAFIFPHFYDISESVRADATKFIMIQSFFNIIYAHNNQCFFTLRSGGDVKNTIMMDSGFFWTVNIPIVAAATYLTDWNITIIFIIRQLTEVIKFFVSHYLFLKEKWLVNLTEHS